MPGAKSGGAHRTAFRRRNPETAGRRWRPRLPDSPSRPVPVSPCPPFFSEASTTDKRPPARPQAAVAIRPRRGPSDPALLRSLPVRAVYRSRGRAGGRRDGQRGRARRDPPLRAPLPLYVPAPSSRLPLIPPLLSAPLQPNGGSSSVAMIRPWADPPDALASPIAGGLLLTWRLVFFFSVHAFACCCRLGRIGVLRMGSPARAFRGGGFN